MEEEERSEVKGYPTAAAPTSSGGSNSEGEDTDTTLATTGVEGLKLEGEEGERKRDLSMDAGGSFSNGDSDNEDIALSSLLRCVLLFSGRSLYSYYCRNKKKHSSGPPDHTHHHGDDQTHRQDDAALSTATPKVVSMATTAEAGSESSGDETGIGRRRGKAKNKKKASKVSELVG